MKNVSTVDVDLTVTDNDLASVSVSTTALTVEEEDTTGDSYTVALFAPPTANVTVTVAGHSGTDVTPSPITLTFTPQNWNTPKTVTVTAGEDDDAAHDTVTLTHSATSTDTGYQGIMIASVDVTVTDNDTLGMTVTPSTLDVDEGDTATYTVKLNTAPTGDVTVAIASDDTGAATVSPASLTFMPTDWNTPQTVTVTGVEDNDRDDENVTLSNNPSGAEYENVSTVDVDLTVTDNDTPSEARLHSLALSGVTLAETFDNDIQSYTATAAAGITETTVTATPLNSDATTVIKLNGVAGADGTVDLELGENIITVGGHGGGRDDDPDLYRHHHAGGYGKLRERGILCV